ncbi:unnamed protein product [Arctogadus glacialis]
MPSSAADFSKDELLIGKLKSLAGDTETKTLFDAYQHDKPFQRNVDLLGSTSTILLKHMKAAFKLLLSTAQVDFPTLGAQLSTFKGTTKPAFATAIVQFIQDARTITCLKCSQDYSPHSSENTTSEVVCLMCCRPGHLGCYADTLIDEETGIVFLCSICLPAKKNPAPDSQVAPPVELEPADNTKLKTTAPLSERLASDSDPSDKKLLQDSEYDRSKPVCPLLLNHECSHGITGLTAAGKKTTFSVERKPTSKPVQHSKRSSNDSVSSQKTQANKNSSSPKPLNHEDFLKHLAQMKADLTKEVTKDLSSLIQMSFQTMMGLHHQQRFNLNRQMYHPSPMQYYPEVHQSLYHHPPSSSSTGLRSITSPPLPDPEGIVGRPSLLPISTTFLLNVQGMDPGIKNQRWKIKSLQENVASSTLHTPFFILTETHLKPYHLEAETGIPGLYHVPG